MGGIRANSLGGMPEKPKGNSNHPPTPKPPSHVAPAEEGSEAPLLDRVRHLARRLHLSIRTENAYVQWIERFLRYHRDHSGCWRHPSELGDAGVNRFLTYLAVERRVSASTQNQALSALLFLYRKLLKLELTLSAERAKLPERLPVVLSTDEVRRVLSEIPQGPIRLMAGLIYGAGLRLMECCRLR